MWATEFENVHSLWHYSEPAIVVDGRRHACSEAFYHAQKPVPYDDAAWCARREGVMEVAVRAKLAADPALVALLPPSLPGPLVCAHSTRPEAASEPEL